MYTLLSAHSSRKTGITKSAIHLAVYASSSCFDNIF